MKNERPSKLHKIGMRARYMNPSFDIKFQKSGDKNYLRFFKQNGMEARIHVCNLLTKFGWNRMSLRIFRSKYQKSVFKTSNLYQS